MELSFIFYILISVIVISGSMYFNVNAGSMSKAVVMSLLFLLVSIYFGMRWFNTSGKSNIGTNVSTTWPPPNSINMCPDFTVLVNKGKSSGNTYAQYSCHDKMGVSKTTLNAEIILNNPSGANLNYRSLIDIGSVDGMCKECFTKGLTWEGVCIPNSPNPVNATVLPPSPA
jgi:hypothetical protein